MLQLEASRGCRYDYIAIYEGNQINNTQLLGNPPLPQYSAKENTVATRQLCPQSENLVVDNLSFNSSEETGVKFLIDLCQELMALSRLVASEL